MTQRDCPECGDPLVKTIDGSKFTCISCGWAGDEDEAPAPTGSPYDVQASPGKVRMEIPENTSGHTIPKPLRMTPDGARRLAEALEIAADDAERQEKRSQN